MTKRKAALITELDVNTFSPAPGREQWIATAEDCRDLLASGAGRTESAALDELVQNNLVRVRKLVFGRDRWQCVHCGSRRNLQAHHRIFRSHGRKDTLAILATCCSECHERIHNGKRTQKIEGHDTGQCPV